MHPQKERIRTCTDGLRNIPLSFFSKCRRQKPLLYIFLEIGKLTSWSMKCNFREAIKSSVWVVKQRWIECLYGSHVSVLPPTFSPFFCWKFWGGKHVNIKIMLQIIIMYFKIMLYPSWFPHGLHPEITKQSCYILLFLHFWGKLGH